MQRLSLKFSLGFGHHVRGETLLIRHKLTGGLILAWTRYKESTTLDLVLVNRLNILKFINTEARTVLFGKGLIFLVEV